MAGEKNYLRIPPDSTGKRVRMGHSAKITYQGKSATPNSAAHVWVVGEEYNITGFGIVNVMGVYEINADSGIIDVNYSNNEVNSNATPSVGAAIIYADGSLQVGTVLNATDVFVNTTMIVGQDNSTYGVNVDETGSMNVRFSEGLPQLDAWGKLRVTGATHLGNYVFSDDDVLSTDFARIEIQGGYVNFDPVRRSVRIGCDDQHPDFVPGLQARADITSHTYHHYTPGSSHLFMNTVRLNDPTALLCDRRWGLYDQNNGFYFQLNYQAEFGVVIRSSASGTLSDVYIPQSQFNKDRMDGTGPSQATLHLENDNIYWIDIQWHGAGRVRFGTYLNGQRVVMHEYYHGNNFPYAMSQTSSLPARYVCIGRPGLTSNLYVETWSASVWAETALDVLTLGSIRTHAIEFVPVTADKTDPRQFCLAVAPPLEIDGQINRKIYVPTKITAFSYDSVTGADAIVDFEIVLNPMLTDTEYETIPGTALQKTISATDLGGGRTIVHETFRGRLDLDLTETFNNFQYGAIKNFAQDGGTVRNAISSITNASPAVITTSDPFLKIREPMPILNDFNTREYEGKYLLSGFTGTTGVNGELVYVKLLSTTTAALYTDEALTIPFDTTTAGTYTGSGGRVDGFAGGRFKIGFYANTRTALYPNCELTISIQWKEINQ